MLVDIKTVTDREKQPTYWLSPGGASPGEVTAVYIVKIVFTALHPWLASSAPTVSNIYIEVY